MTPITASAVDDNGQISYGGLVAGILAAETVTEGGGILNLGLRSSSLVIPFSILVMPMIGGSPFRTNSYSPNNHQSLHSSIKTP